MSLRRQLFPLIHERPPQEYVEDRLNIDQQKTNVGALEAAIKAALDLKALEALRDIAISKDEEEDKRHASIISRGQALLVGLSLFGFLLTFAASLVTSLSNLEKPILIVCVGIAVYIVSQIVIMVFNILQTLRGIPVPRAGSSDMTTWISNPDEFLRQQTITTLRHYRWGSLTNSWRFSYLDGALLCLRNIVLALSLLALVLLGSGLFFPVHKDPLLVIFS